MKVRKFTSRRNHRRSNQRTRRRALFERLEDRRVMAVDFASAFSAGGTGSDGSWDLALDGAGNTCIAGNFTGTLDFDPGPGIYELTSSPSGGGRTFAAKYDSSGNLLWAQNMDGGGGGWFGPQVAAANDGAVYVTGSFTGSATFGTTTLTSLGDLDVFVAKLDADGSILWVRQFGGVYTDHGNDVATDGAGNAYITAETNEFSPGGRDALIAKLSASGSVLWATEIGASSSTTTRGKNTTSSGWARGLKIAVSGTGDVYATGQFRGKVDFDAGAGTNLLSGDAFVLKLSSAGGLTWARAFTASLIFEPHDIAVDGNGNVYSTGVYYLSADFDPGTAKSQKFILDAGTDQSGAWNAATYVSALNSNGNFLWAKSTQMVEGIGYGARAHAMALDNSGGIYIAGEFSGTADFNPGSGALQLTSAGDVDAYVWKLDTSGNFVWAGQMGGAAANRARGIGVDASGNIFVAGGFFGTADFDPGVGTFELTSNGGADLFLVKLTQASSLAAAAAGEGQSSNLLLAAQSPRRLSKVASIDRALASLAENSAVSSWDDSLDDELLLSLVGG
jgi:hypothetical protein